MAIFPPPFFCMACSFSLFLWLAGWVWVLEVSPGNLMDEMLWTLNDLRIRRFYFWKNNNTGHLTFLGHLVINSDRNSFWGISNHIFMTHLTDKASAGDSKIILKSSSVKIAVVKKPVSDSNSKQTVEGNKQDAQNTGAATSSGLLSLCQQYDSDEDDWLSDPCNLYICPEIHLPKLFINSGFDFHRVWCFYGHLKCMLARALALFTPPVCL